jgi:cytochrome P450 monooxygenase
MDFLFGRSLNALQAEVPAECTEFLQAFSRAQKGVTNRREAGWLQFRLNRVSEDKEWKEAYMKVHKYVDEQVVRALQATADQRSAPEKPETKERYVLLDEMAKQVRDPIQLRYHILGVFNPARDTTSILVGNALFQLARHPQVWAKLRKTSLELGDTPLTFEKLKSLVDFRYVIHETIRVCGPAARIWRVAIRDTVLPVGGGPDQKSPVFVSRGTPVVLGIWSMNHDKDIWGDDVDDFKPERWIGRKPLWDFVPFLGGPRICPAQQQVLTHSIYVLVRLTRKFAEMENCDPVFEYIEEFTLGFSSRNGVKVAFKNV